MIRITVLFCLIFSFSITAFAEDVVKENDQLTNNTEKEKVVNPDNSEVDTDKNTEKPENKDEKKQLEQDSAKKEMIPQSSDLPMNRQEMPIDDTSSKGTNAQTVTEQSETGKSESDSAEQPPKDTQSKTETSQDEDYQSSWEGQKDNDDKVKDQPEDPNENRVRLEFFGGAMIPSTGQKIGGGIGGFIAYDFWDKLGVELYLNQCWGETTLDVTADDTEVNSDLKILSVRPGLRYRFHRGDLFRAHASVHGGLEQVNWKRPDYGNKYENNFSMDVGLGGELFFGRMWLVNLFANYFMGMNVMPSTTEGDLKKYHGIFIGLAVGVSAPASKVFN